MSIVEQRVRDALGAATLHNGTLLADLVLTVLRADRAFRPHQQWPTMSIATIRELAEQLTEVIATGPFHVTLPSGTIAHSRRIGSFTVGNQMFALDVDRPGLHSFHSLTRRPGGSNLDLLHRHIEKLTTGSAWGSLGLPVPVTVDDDGKRYPLQFAPFARANNVILQRNVNSAMSSRFCSLSPDAVRDLAGSIVRDMETLWHRSDEIGRRAAAVRAAGERVAGTVAGAAFHAVTVFLSDHRDDDKPPMAIEYMACDTALRPAIIVDHNLTEDLQDYAAPYELDRCVIGSELRTQGADGRIDEIALGILRAAPGGPAPLLAQLASSYEADVTFPARSGAIDATLFWNDGLISARILQSSAIWLHGSQMTFRKKFVPHTVMDNLPGCALHALAELPFPCDAKIEFVSAVAEGTKVKLASDVWLVDFSTGRIWQ